MKKSIVALSLIAFTGLMLLTGCGSTATPATTAIPTSSAAASVGLLCKDGLAIDNSVMGIFSYASSAGTHANARANAPTGIAYNGAGDGFWSAVNVYLITEEGTTYSYNYSYKFRVWNKSGTEITSTSALDTMTESTVGKLWLAVAYTYSVAGVSGSYTFGTVANPMKIEGYGTTSQTISGTINYASTYGTENYEIIITYGSLTMSTAGYPSGSVSWEMKTNGASAYQGSITYDGTNIATCTFSSGGSGSYKVNLDTGAVTAASL